MRQVLVAVMAVVCASVAHADVPRKTFKALGDVSYLTREGEASCGKEPRDAIKAAVKKARTITISAKKIQMNNGEAWTIEHEESDGLFAGKTVPAPTKAFPNRKITMMVGVMLNGDDAIFVFSRIAESDGVSCSDSYRVSIE